MKRRLLAIASFLFLTGVMWPQGVVTTKPIFTVFGWGKNSGLTEITGTDEAFTFSIQVGNKAISKNPSIRIAFAPGEFNSVPTCDVPAGWKVKTASRDSIRIYPLNRPAARYMFRVSVTCSD